MSFESSLAALKASLDQGNDAFTDKHFRLLVEALEALSFSDLSNGGDVLNIGWLDFSAATELTIASGVVTATQTLHAIDTEADAASDDLDTIEGGAAGRMLILRAQDSSRSVVLKDNTGNLRLSGDFTLDNATDHIVLISGGGTWVELSRSDNGA